MASDWQPERAGARKDKKRRKEDRREGCINGVFDFGCCLWPTFVAILGVAGGSLAVRAFLVRHRA